MATERTTATGWTEAAVR